MSGILIPFAVIKANRTLSNEFVPSSIPDMELWIKADEGVTVTGSGVSQALDYSGKNRHATQGIDARRPPLALSEMNGKPVISPVSANQNFLSLASSITLTDFSFIIVWKYNADTATYPIGRSTSTNTYISPRHSSIQVRAIATGHTFTVPSASANQSLIDMVLRSSGNLRVFRNEGESSTGVISNANNFVFDQLFANAATYYGTVKLAEALVYSRQITAGEITQLHNYMKTKYAITY